MLPVGISLTDAIEELLVNTLVRIRRTLSGEALFTCIIFNARQRSFPEFSELRINVLHTT
uniref:Uncharacterized protein n=1 Tax=Salmonella enterica subsp. salamae TaxID=59202 RepID=I3W477_SALER|nr:hypothetical protein [Salmonella enterica subsp. salamae]